MTPNWTTLICVKWPGLFSRRVRRYCAKQGTPLIEAKTGERKHELAEEFLPHDPGFQGLFLVITANAPAPVWEVNYPPIDVSPTFIIARAGPTSSTTTFI